MRQCLVPFDCGRSYQYPREVWRPTRVEIRCAVGPGSALLAQTLDPAEDLRPRPRRHTVPANEMLVRFIPIYIFFSPYRYHDILPEQNDIRIFVEKYYRK